MKKLNRFISFILTAATVFLIVSHGIIPVSASDEEWENMLPEETEMFVKAEPFTDDQSVPSPIREGSCGEATTWSLDEDGILIVQGIGSVSEAPWEDFKDDIKKIIFLDGVTKIGAGIFSGCKSLEIVEMAESIVAIGDRTFEDCINLEYIDFSDMITEIGKNAFSGALSLKFLTLPEKLESLGDCAFENCDVLTSLVISDHVKKLGESVFADCESLTNVVLGNAIGMIPEHAFSGCTSLEEISVPFSVKSIEQYAFSQCKSLKTVKYLYTREWWEDIAIDNKNEANRFFLDAERQYLTISPEEITAEGICSETIGWTLDSAGVLILKGTGKIPAYNYYNKPSPWNGMRNAIVKIIVEEGIENIPSDAFYYCRNLTEITIPRSVNKIDASAFDGCTKLTDVYYHYNELFWKVFDDVLPDVTVHYTEVSADDIIASGACGEAVNWSLNSEGTLTINGIGSTFDYKELTQPWSERKQAIRKVVIGEGVTAIGEYAFYNCNNLETVIFSETVTKIDSCAFSQCTSLKALSFPSSLASVSDKAFYGCSALTELILPDSVTAMGKNVFEDAVSLKTVVWGNHMETIPAYTFSGCMSLQEITIPFSVKTIEEYAFSGCHALDTVNYLCTKEWWKNIDIDNHGESNRYFMDAERQYETIFPTQMIMSGECTETISWTLDSSGVLTLIGTGKMPDYHAYINYQYTPYSPWFSVCKIIRKVVIGEGIKTISDYSFYNCMNLSEITIPRSVDTIGENAFKECLRLTDVYYLYGESLWQTIDGVKYLPDATIHFEKKTEGEIIDSGSCGDMITWTLNAEGVLHLIGQGRMPVYDATSYPWYARRFAVTKIIVDERIGKITGACIDDCVNAVSIEMSENEAIVGTCGNAVDWYLDPDGTLIIEGIGEMFPYQENTQPWYEQRESVRKIRIKDGVTSISSYAFSNLDQLISVEMSDTVERIDIYAFYDCNALQNVVCGAALETIEDHAFHGCINLTEITLPFALRYIKYRAFYNDYNLKTVYYLYTEPYWNEIGMDSGNDVVRNATIEFLMPEDVEIVAKGACGADAKWYIDSNGVLTVSGMGPMTDYKDYSYQPWSAYRQAVTKIVVEEGITHIGEYAFAHCTNMTDVIIPRSVQTIGEYAFNSCTKLKTVTYLYTKLWYDTIVIGYNNSSVRDAEKVFTEIDTTETVYEGRCGEAVTWSIDTEGVLRLNGIGGMYGYYLNTSGYGTANDRPAPWYAFRNIIKKVIIGEGITRIGAYAFFQCTNLTDVETPESVTTIGNYAFYNCDALTECNIADHITTLGSYAFYDCDGLTKVTIGNGVTCIDDYVFYDCDGITEIIYGNAVKTIGNAAFTGCDNLKKMTLGSSVGAIGRSAFASCTRLMELTIPFSVYRIDSYAFNGCSRLETIYYLYTKPYWKTIVIGSDNDSVSSAEIIYQKIEPAEIVESGICGEDAKWSIDSDGVLTVSGTGPMTDYNGYSYQPWSAYRQAVTKIVVAEGITHIGEYAFAHCTNMTDVIIPRSVQTIGEYAFNSCTKLKTVTYLYTKLWYDTIVIGYNNSPVWDAEKVFTEIDMTETVYEGRCGEAVTWSIDTEGVLRLNGIGGMYGYYLNTSGYSTANDQPAPWYDFRKAITEVIVGEGITRIGKYAFYDCKNLADVEISESITTIDTYAFYNCDALTEFDLADHITTLGGYAFYGCDGLTKVTIGNGIAELQQYTFYACSNLREITLPLCLERIGSNVFVACGNLTTVYYKSDKNWWKNISISSDNTSLSDAEIIYTELDPDTVMRKGFCGENAEWTLSVGGTLRISGEGSTYDYYGYSIGTNAWVTYYSGWHYLSDLITEVIIEEGIREIGQGFCGLTYAGTPNLTYVKIADTVETIGINAFSDCYALKTVVFGNGVKTIRDSAFEDCDALTEIDLGNSLEAIRYFAFANCEKLERIFIPSAVTGIDRSAFSNSPNVIIVCEEGSYAETYAKQFDIPYEYYFDPGKTIFVRLLNESEEIFTSGYTTRWYIGEEMVGLGNTLYNMDENAVYRCEVLLDYTLGQKYIQPDDMIFYGDTEKDTLSFVLTPFESVKISGILTDEDHHTISDAEVTFTQTMNGVYKNTMTVKTDENGIFTADILNTPTSLMISADSYYVTTQNVITEISDQTEINIGTVVLKKLPNSKITLDYQWILAAENDAEQTVSRYADNMECQFRIFNRTKSLEITDYTVQNQTILFGEGVVSGGDMIEIEAKLKDDISNVTNVTVTLDEFGIAHTVLTFTEQGYIRYTAENNGTVLHIFNKNGEFIEKCYGENKIFVSGNLSDGEYQIVLMQRADTLVNISHIDMLTKFGLIENEDFILKTVSVCRGEIFVLKDIHIPELDLSKLEYTVPDQTRLSTNYSSAAVGRYISLRAEYQLSDQTDSKDEYITIVLPDHVIFMEGSVTLNGKTCPYIKDGNTIRVYVGADRGTVRCYVMADHAKQAFVEAFVHFSSEKGDLVQPIGSFMLQITDATLTLPAKTGKTKMNLSGTAIAQSKVVLYCNGEKIAQISANKVGTWNAFVELPHPYTHAAYEFYAVITTPKGVIYETARHISEYDADYSEVERVTMINTCNGVEYRTLFKFLEPDYSKHSYIWNPDEPDFTFIVEMSGDNISEVKVVTVSASGEEIYTFCKYDEHTGHWIGTRAYPNSATIPTGLYVLFSPKDSGSQSFEGKANAKNDTEDYIYEKPVFENAEKPSARMDFAIESVSPSVGGIGEVTLCLKGKLLEPNAKIFLTDGEIKREAEDIYWVNHEMLYAKFKTVGLHDGIYTISAVCGQKETVLSDCFTVDRALKVGRISYEIHLDDSVEAGRIGKGYISAVNTGNTDVLSPVLALIGDNIVFGSDKDLLDNEAIVFLQNYEGLAGTLSAGETAVYSFFYQVPKKGNFRLKSLDLGRITSPIDNRIVLKQDSVQEEILFQYANAMMGATYRDYAESLAEMATALTPLETTVSVKDLEYAYLHNAMGLFADTSVESVQDLISTDLSFVRTFTPGYIECKNGMFGFGWKSQYDIYAEYRNEEDKQEQIIVFFGGTPMAYLKDSDDKFISAIDKNEVITKNPDGSMVLAVQSGIQYVFDKDGKLLSLTDLNGNSVQMAYENGFLTSVSTNNGDTISFTYVNGKVIFALSETTGEKVEYEYDGELLTKVKTEYGDIMYSYQKLSLEKEQYVINKITYSDGTILLYSYDAYGRVTQMSDGEVSVHYEYGLHEVNVNDSLGNTTSYKYDANGNLIWMIDTKDQVSYYTYDTENHLTSVSSGLLYHISYEYNSEGLPIQVIRPDDNIVSYQYDTFGNITSVTDAKQNVTRYEYDDKGNATAIIYADGSKESYTYDEKGRLQIYTKRSGVTVSYTYDDKNNVTKSVYSTGEIISYTYNQFSAVTSITENGQTTGMQYDEKGLLTKIIYPDGKTVSYTYDELGRLLSVTDAEGYVTGYVYDEKGYLQNVTDGDNTLVTYVYNTDGTLKRQNNANGTYTEYTYTNGYNTTIMHYGADDTVISSYIYTYDTLGNISSMTDLNGTRYYTYDQLSQLISSTAPDGTVTQYRYDAAGNRTEVTVDGKKTVYETNALNQYTSYGDTVCEYDANGNLIRKTTAKGTETYIWDYLDRLVKYIASDGTVYEYAYDAFGLRNQVTVNGMTTNYLNDPMGYGYTLTEYRTDETVHYNIADSIVVSQNSDQIYYYNANHLGSVTEITDKNGNTVNAYTYNHEGEILSKTESISNPFTYVGIYGIINDENGLIYDRARYISAETDSFISVDPLGQNADLNVYRYVSNNPVMFVDISGEVGGISGGGNGYNRYNRYKSNRMNIGAKQAYTSSSYDKVDKISSVKEVNSYTEGGYHWKKLKEGISMWWQKTWGKIPYRARNFIRVSIQPFQKLPPHLKRFWQVALAAIIVGIIIAQLTQPSYSEELPNADKSTDPSAAATATIYTPPNIDPSGYVYEGVTSNRLEGVKATIYYEGYLLDDFGEIDYDAGLQMIEWTEASEYNEINPQITDANGCYGWYVLPGKWIVKYEKDGYDVAWSEWMEVPPEYTDVNINLMTQTAPTVSSVIAYKDNILITFSQYMDITSIHTEHIQITMNGENMNGTLIPMNAEYNFEKTAEYASVFKFIPDSELNTSVTVRIADVSNYASIVMKEVYTKDVKVIIEPEEIEVSEELRITYMDSETLTVQVLPQNIGAGIPVHLVSYSPSKLMVINETVLTDENGRAIFEIKALLPGETNLLITVEGTEISETVKCTVSDVDGKFTDESDILCGDMNGDGNVNSADAIYLLRHTIMQNLYPITQSGDINGDGKVNSADAIYLLRHTIMPELYPIA